MDFLYTGVKGLDAPTFKSRIDDAQLKLDGLPPVFHFSNHDTTRQWTRFGDGKNDGLIARLTAAMTLTLRGTALMYYGEEIGMADLKPAELAAFPLGPKRIVKDNRDPVRSPMQWTGAAGAGFSTGDPWLPVAAAARTSNVAGQLADKTSIYHWYAQLLSLRKSNPAIREGAYVPLESGNDKVVAYARKATSGHGVLVLLNMSGERQKLAIKGWNGAVPKPGKIIMASTKAGAADMISPVLEPFATVLVQFITRP